MAARTGWVTQRANARGGNAEANDVPIVDEDEFRALMAEKGIDLE